MKKTTRPDDNELRAEYDASTLRDGVRGKHFKSYQAGTNLVRLDPDVAFVFQSEKAVNEALRSLIKTATDPATPGDYAAASVETSSLQGRSEMVDRVKSILEAAFPGIELQLEELADGRVVGSAVWSGFAGMDQVDRQTVLRNAVPPSDRPRIDVVLTYTPDEINAMKAA